MTWGSFHGFWLMRELGQEDAVYRNYDLDKAHFTYVSMGITRTGVVHPYANTVLGVQVIAQYLVDCGVPRGSLGKSTALYQYDTLEERLAEWAVWAMIRKGERPRWPLRKFVAPAPAVNLIFD